MRYILALMMAALLLFAPWVCAAAEDGTAPPGQMTGPSPEPSPAPTEKEQARLYIDNRNLYEHMGRTYSQGYMPTVKGSTTVAAPPFTVGI